MEISIEEIMRNIVLIILPQLISLSSSFVFFISNTLSIPENHPYIVTSLSSLISFILGWKVNNRVVDRELLRTLYVNLYEEITGMKTNILNYKYCFEMNPENVRTNMKRAGQYKLISTKLRDDIDNYYQKCDEYNKKLTNAEKEIKEICITEVRKIKTEEDHKKFSKKFEFYSSAPNLLLKGVYEKNGTILSENQGYLLIDNYSEWDGVITSDDLIRNSMSFDDFIDHLIKIASQNKDVIGFRQLQNKLKDPKDLLKKIEKRIQNPNPLIELIT